METLDDRAVDGGIPSFSGIVQRLLITRGRFDGTNPAPGPGGAGRAPRHGTALRLDTGSILWQTLSEKATSQGAHDL